MAHLPSHIIEMRRTFFTKWIIQFYEFQEDEPSNYYALQCPCLPECIHMDVNDVPRIVLPTCLYSEELNYFEVTEPFLEEYGFRVTWHYLEQECEHEFSCGLPNISQNIQHFDM